MNSCHRQHPASVLLDRVPFANVPLDHVPFANLRLDRVPVGTTKLGGVGAIAGFPPSRE